MILLWTHCYKYMSLIQVFKMQWALIFIWTRIYFKRNNKPRIPISLKKGLYLFNHKSCATKNWQEENQIGQEQSIIELTRFHTPKDFQSHAWYLIESNRYDFYELDVFKFLGEKNFLFIGVIRWSLKDLSKTRNRIITSHRNITEIIP